MEGGEVGRVPGQVDGGAAGVLGGGDGGLAAGRLAQRDHVVGLFARRRFADFVHRYHLQQKGLLFIALLFLNLKVNLFLLTLNK